jgi:2,4-dienoyl-CoA reductase-like NADH-dependent reductase (Old Yellow Enzyme family)
MTSLFEPTRLGQLQVKNRFVQSATFEAMASRAGEVTDPLVQRYARLARGEVGLLIPGGLNVHPLGRTSWRQTGIEADAQISGLASLVGAVHREGSAIAFQLTHGGAQAKRDVIGQPPLAPSAAVRDPMDFRKPQAMTEAQIEASIRAFGQAVRRAVEAGADGVQLHAAHGYLINEFLSPFYNRRRDAWGGSDKNRFRFLRAVVLECQAAMPAGMPLLVKLNAHDYTPRPGITPLLAATYSQWLAGLGVAGIEISCGTAFSFMNMCRGRVPLEELVEGVPWWQRLLVRVMLQRQVGRYAFDGPYNLGAALMIKSDEPRVPIMVVGGLRRVADMEAIVRQGQAEFVSMCRPFIREPLLVSRIRRGETHAAGCISCNRCFAAMVRDMPVRCYVDGIPSHVSSGMPA